MTDIALTALFMSIPPTLTALGAIVLGILADRRSGKKLDHITVLTNSTLTAANKRIDMLEQRLQALDEPVPPATTP